MRIVFMGTPEFAIPSLRALFESQHEVVTVVTAPDRPKGRGQKVRSSPVKEFALHHGLPILQPADLRDPGFVQNLKDVTADIFVIVAFRILPFEVYSIPPNGSFNLHASLLPKYRGAAPIQWAIINGETETGVTTFFLQEKVDTGSIIAQERLTIGSEETSGEVHDRLSRLGADLVIETVHLIEQGSVTVMPQEISLASNAPKLFKNDCRIDWSQPAAQVHNFVRGLSPVPGAWTTIAGKVIRIFRTSVVKQDAPSRKQKGGAPGSIAFVDADKLWIQSGDHLVSVLELQQEGRRRMEISGFLRGFRFTTDDSLQ